MGTTCTRERPTPPTRFSQRVPVPVTLHIYDLGTSDGTKAVNSLLRKIGTGAFHCGVEIYGCEWSYSDVAHEPGEKVEGTGIFCVEPRACDGHSYSESISMGTTAVSESEVLTLLAMLKMNWAISEYSTLTKNCCHFCDEFCVRLGVGSIPTWVVSLAGAGAAIVNAGDTVCCSTVASARFDPRSFLCCPGDERNKESEVVNIDTIDALPVLPPIRPISDSRPNSMDSASPRKTSMATSRAYSRPHGLDMMREKDQLQFHF